MAEHVYIEDIADHVGETVTIKGWLYNMRSSGKLHFLELRDGTGFMQGVMFKGDVDEELFDKTNYLRQETSIIVTGTVKEDERAPFIPFEMGISDIEVVAEPTQEYPVTHKEHGVAFLMENRHLWMRTPRQVAIMKVRHEIIKAIRGFFDDRKFQLVDAPIFTPAAVEGTTTLFETEYFSQKAYLTQSGQLYMEAGAMAFGKVYCFGPTFRAEKSKTRRHLTEFWMVEPEVAYMELDEDMDLAEAFVQHIVSHVLEHCKDELETLERDTAPLEKIAQPFPRISYDEAVEIIKENGGDIEYGADFGAPDETILGEHFDTPVMVHRYPADIKAFYMRKDPNDETKALCVDVIAPEGYGEIIGGGEREWDVEKLEKSIEEHNLPMEAFEWYLDVRRYGSVPHAGFGLGLERTVAWMCGLHHVRETIPFPRMMDKIIP
ncbi:asparagine--tRNA ligase [Persicimonas caeni]|uniref:Asparagine--tRNA ligase n=1 Tax=Persicimonas caeni TaxID=2292766 RepID=A0A4Y6PPG3_PERCE|nr:asparagine--tRNA ligase [Persicimonas caeni]QDG49999.1 asparagine--tRNA ligase [Persicimonas caeni]QED31220.1 asparagine--tRNA ligase [Persicimonas caeni]